MLSKDLSQTKKNEEEGSEKKEIKGMKLTLTHETKPNPL